PPPQVDQTKFTVIEVTPEKVEVIKENKEIEEKETAVATETKEGEASPEKPEEVVVVEKPKENIEKAGTGEESNEPLPEFKVAQPATFEGGINEFRKELQKKIVYPSVAKRKGTEGKVVLEFVIDRDGSMSEVRALSKLGDGCEEEAIKALQKMTKKWSPGRDATGKAVRQRKTIPVIFKLEK
ncbi:MAG: energy transducer TonB, partial [Thermonemataceae bacterium]|nr:energy transducer TonB [Thermonemataceae bacterium]